MKANLNVDTVALLLLLKVFCLVQSVAVVGKNEDFSKKLSRVKREWSYPPVVIDETPPARWDAFRRKKLVRIKSSNPLVENYVLLNTPEVQSGMVTIENIPGTKEAQIYQDLPIDREDLDEDSEFEAYFMITARALNSAGHPVEPTDAEIKVIIRDENDNPPEFVPTSLQGDVRENAGVGQGFMTVQATDKDSKGGDRFNGVVRYFYDRQIDPPSDTPVFAVVEDTGDVTVIGQLDRETTPTIKFLVRAEDTVVGYPANTATATVTVQILDANDHAPVFDNTPYQTTVGELAPEGTVVQTVFASDEDEGENRAAEFRIESGNTKDHFDIRSTFPNPDGQSYGEILVKKPLDFESGDTSFTLTIAAFNPGAANAELFKTTATVSITVADENEPPVFTNQPYTGNLRENRQGVVDNVATVHAEDEDFGGGQTVSYSLVNGIDWFEISSDGIISAIAPVDRENPKVNQETSIFTLIVRATGNYEEPKSSTAEVAIRIGDVNDNAPQKDSGWAATICEKPNEKMRANITVIRVKDSDSPSNGPPFSISIVDGFSSPFNLELLAPTTGAIVQTLTHQFNAAEVSKYEIPIELVDSVSAGESKLTSTETLTISVCTCDDNTDEGGTPVCKAVVIAPGGVNIMLIIIIIAVILILLIIILAVVAYRRRRLADEEKTILFDEDDVRENLQAYHDEGGGEEDNEDFDISALQAPPLVDPKRQDVTPQTRAQPQPRTKIPPDQDVGDFINEAKQNADNDPTAPPFDSLLVFDYEGQGSDAGSLSSLNSGTTDASQDYDYLNEWGPKFKKLADMYGGGESD